MYRDLIVIGYETDPHILEKGKHLGWQIITSFFMSQLWYCSDATLLNITPTHKTPVNLFKWIFGISHSIFIKIYIYATIVY